MKNHRNNGRIGRFFFHFTAPFIIGGSRWQRFYWLRNNILPSRVEQENRYHHWGFRKESPFIYLTYLLNPFQSFWRFLKEIFNMNKDSLNKS